ncbi:MAG: Crp/Fnr family transcriptional regulator [Acidithiobacillales bacterium]
MTGPEPIKLLASLPLFAGLTELDRKALGPLCRISVYAKGETIFSEGDPAKELSFIVLGRVKVVKAGPRRDLIVGLLGPGEPVGIVAAFEGRPYPASAVALEPSTVIHVPEREFFDCLGSRPGLVRRLFQGLMLRQLELTRRLTDLTGHVDARIARLFLTLAEKAGRPEGSGVFVGIALTRQEIADLAATTIETAIRIMSRWGKEGVVLTREDGFLIRDAEALKRSAGAR